MNKAETSMRAKYGMWVVWPSFLAACGLEMLVFAFIDPLELHWLGGPLQLSRAATYTLVFFSFWLFAMAASALTLVLSRQSTE